MRLYIRWLDRLNKLLTYTIGILLIVMVLVMAYQFSIRFISQYFGVSTSAPWTAELPLYCLLWLIFLGAAIATRNNRLITVDIILSNLPEKWEKKGILISVLISIFFYIGIFIAGINWAIFGMSETSTSMGISMFYVYLSLPFSAFVMILNSIGYLINLFFIKEENTNDMIKDAELEL